MRLFFILFFISTSLEASIVIQPSPPPTLTVAQIFKRNVSQKLTLMFNDMNNFLPNLYTMIWNNPNGRTPQQILTALGTDCVQAHQMITAFSSALNAVVTNSIAAEPKTVTENPDGTCTVGP